MTNLPRYENDSTLMHYAWPGGYPIFYVVADGGVLCPECARMAEAEGLANDSEDEQWYIVAADVNYEDEQLFCDHCYAHIPSAYGEDEQA